jgi:hypothetical protein
MKAKKWGWNCVDGVYFFLEEGRELPPMCPIDVLPSEPCPHKTKGEPLARKEPRIYFTEKEYKFPRNVEVTSSRIRYTGKNTLQTIKVLLRQTNYVPVLLENITLDPYLMDFLDNLHNEVVLSGRSVVMTGDPYIPLPSFVKKM